MFNIDFSDLTGSSRHFASHPSYHQSPFSDDSAVAADLSISMGLLNKLRHSCASLRQWRFSRHSPTLIHSSMSNPDLLGSLSLEPQPFGEGLAIVVNRGKVAVASAVGTELDVAHSVFASVLNATSLLSASSSGADEFFFVKSQEQAFSSDYLEMQRLSGSYNITSESLRPSGRQLCAESASLSSRVCLLYGTEDRRSPAMRHVIRARHKQAVEAAWRREAALLKSGFPGKWSTSQRAELQRRGQVRGFTPVEVKSAHKFPELIGQSSNILFVRDSDAAKRRQQ